MPFFEYFGKKSFRQLIGAAAVCVSPVAAWQISSQFGSQDSVSSHPKHIEAINSGVNGGHPSVTWPNPPATSVVIPEVVSPKDIPEAMAVEVNEGEYLTSKGLHKKLENGAYLTPEGLVIQTENGALIHLPSGLPPTNQ